MNAKNVINDIDWPSRMEVVPIDELLVRTNDLNAQMDGALRAAIEGLGGTCSETQDPRTVATGLINKICEGSRRMMSWLTAKLWRPTTGLAAVPTQVLKERAAQLAGRSGAVLDPAQIENEVTRVITELLNRREYDAVNLLLQAFPSASPVGYGTHIEMSGHDTGNGQTFASLLEANGLQVDGSFLEVGARGGNTTAEMVRRGIVDPERDQVVLVDPNAPCLEYAGRMLRPRLGELLVLEARGIQDVARDSEIGTAYSALTMQWIDSEGDVPVVPLVVDNLRRVLVRDGLFLFVGEEPVNATAATPTSVRDGLDIGFSDGALSYRGAQNLLESRDFEPSGCAVLVRLSIPTPDPAFLAELDPETRKIVTLLDAYSDHYAIGTAYRNAGKSVEV